MVVANPKEVPEYELNPLELQVRRSDGIAKAWSSSFHFLDFYYLLHDESKIAGHMPHMP